MNKKWMMSIVSIFISLVVLSSAIAVGVLAKKQFHLNNQRQTVMAKETIPKATNKKMYKEIDQMLKKNHFNGNVYVLYKNKEIMNQAYGYASPDHSKRLTKDSMYLIGSSNKMLTGMLIKQLELDGKINVNDPVKKYIPNFPYVTIRIKDLLLHQSGLQPFKAREAGPGLDGAVKKIIENGVNPKNYGKFVYRDVNYILLAKVIENVTHQPYEVVLQNNVFKPLHLNQSGFFDNPNFKRYFVTGLKYSNNQWIYDPAQFLDRFYGAGNVYMSSKDIGQFANQFIHGKLFNPVVMQQILSNDFTEQAYRYGFYKKPGYYRMRGYFFDTDSVCWFNRNVVVVLNNNKLKPSEIKNNENLLGKIFKKVEKNMNQKAYQ
ncbi:serine hydrolase [Macrococcus sp. DPC7161]|uniref:serine hydrolase domain-containing protein n=1 Tax=Macrococcus sp. DPC7161 TaxID=2507060 RepID=UPI0013E90A5F|nr:serine hydrolase domain-containing protein [Macrococcus sp. DPC7161]